MSSKGKGLRFSERARKMLFFKTWGREDSVVKNIDLSESILNGIE